MRPTVLILGAGKWQMPIIAKAKSRGYRVVAADGSAEAVGLGLADIPIICDITNPNEILKRVRPLRISGVVCDQTEVAILPAAFVARELGLPCASEEVLRRSTDKTLMRECWEKAGIPIPKFRRIRSLPELITFSGEIGFPLITKPTASSGSQGVRVSKNPNDLEIAYHFALKHSSSGEVIAEQYVTGREYTIEAFSSGGKTQVLAVSQKTKPDSSFQVSTLLEYPPDLPEEMLKRVEQTVEKAVDALGIKNGPSHTEVLLSKAGPVLVETASRGGGFRISSDIITLASGFDQGAAILDVCLGNKVEVNRKWNHAVVLGFFHAEPGKVISIRGTEEVLRNESLYAFELFVKPGDLCGEMNSDRSRAGYFILSDPSVAKIREETRRVYDQLVIETQEGTTA